MEDFKLVIMRQLFILNISIIYISYVGINRSSEVVSSTNFFNIRAHIKLINCCKIKESQNSNLSKQKQ